MSKPGLESMDTKQIFYSYVQSLQNDICSTLERIDGKSAFISDVWERPEGGGGTSRVIANGNVFEKGGVNVSSVHGELPQSMRDAFGVSGKKFYAC